MSGDAVDRSNRTDSSETSYDISLPKLPTVDLLFGTVILSLLQVGSFSRGNWATPAT
jgi:hypothetical protein